MQEDYDSHIGGILETQMTTRTPEVHDILEGYNPLTAQDIRELNAIIESPEYTAAEKTFHMAHVCGNAPFLIGCRFAKRPKVECAILPINSKTAGYKDGMKFIHPGHSNHLVCGSRLQPSGGNRFNAKPPNSNDGPPMKDRMMHLGRMTMRQQVEWMPGGGIAGDGELATEPSCTACGMPTFNMFINVISMTRYGSDQVATMEHFNSSMVTAHALAQQIDAHTAMLKANLGIPESHTWVKCDTCSPRIRFKSATDFICDKNVQRWLLKIQENYRVTHTNWVLPSRHFLFASLPIPYEVPDHAHMVAKKEEIKLQKFSMEKVSFLEQIGVCGVITELENAVKGKIQVSEDCILQQELQPGRVASAQIKKGEYVEFDIHALPSALQGTDENGRRIVSAKLGDHVVCNIYRRMDRSTNKVHTVASFVFPSSVFLINAWAMRAGNSFANIPHLRAMYCEADSASGGINSVLARMTEVFSKFETPEHTDAVQQKMAHAAAHGALDINNISIPKLVAYRNEPWLREYIKFNAKCVQIMNKGHRDDWPVFVAEQLFEDEKSTHSARMSTWMVIYHKLYPFFNAAHRYQGMEKLHKACLRKMMMDAEITLKHGKPALFPPESLAYVNVRAFSNQLMRLGTNPASSDVCHVLEDLHDHMSKKTKRRR